MDKRSFMHFHTEEYKNNPVTEVVIHGKVCDVDNCLASPDLLRDAIQL